MDYATMCVGELDALIEQMESANDHDNLPPIYDQVVARRNELVDPWNPSQDVSA